MCQRSPFFPQLPFSYRGHSLSTYTKFSKKTVRIAIFSEYFAYVLSEWSYILLSFLEKGICYQFYLTLIIFNVQQEEQKWVNLVPTVIVWVAYRTVQVGMFRQVGGQRRCYSQTLITFEINEENKTIGLFRVERIFSECLITTYVLIE